MPVRIGITSLRASNDREADREANLHAEAVRDCGAVPVLLPKDLDPHDVRSLLRLSGIIFSGGGDVDPVRYGGRTTLPTDRLDDRRDAFELALMREVLEAELPLLCVCRGMQVANVALGGSIIEHLPEYLGAGAAVRHDGREEPGSAAIAHEVDVVAGSLLRDVVAADRIVVNSYHHQAVRELGTGLLVAARAGDGVVEAVERAGSTAFFLGVQWHPELMRTADSAAARIYARFVAASGTS
ncbi:MAG TPA: gamma-glutamyl-gamma-aminobutyrate hydrolase family protein [Candidatus Elarobacter sp.]|nr:gamma-glutamyl-gamma-aminobutyrate hydrolase family protein [Candidatus Elarobacter sp.]